MDFKITCKDIESTMRVMRMFELKKQTTCAIIDKKYKEARSAQKELAKLALEDMDSFIKLPNFRFNVFSLKEWFALKFRKLGYSIYRAFTKKTPEEKQFKKDCKAAFKTKTPEEIKATIIDINIPPLY